MNIIRIANLSLKSLGVYLIYVVMGEGVSFISLSFLNGIKIEDILENSLIFSEYLLLLIAGLIFWYFSESVVKIILKNENNGDAEIISDINYQKIQSIVLFILGISVILFSASNILRTFTSISTMSKLYDGNQFYNNFRIISFIQLSGRALTLIIGTLLIRNREKINVVKSKIN
ncbi:hypothetical protein [Helicovermis profundi]|uniref:Uncharacterized protein n=1 Tax=Helicovermis profundi TaxID=3065157 RepID=A0AAU9EM88_9FIRM|nr:hypothetical protein HLPR_15350 [Clostridia bacterium S502]